jgi:hypothetical protein
MSAIGTKQTLPSGLHVSAFGSKADIISAGGIGVSRGRMKAGGALMPPPANLCINKKRFNARIFPQVEA